MTQQTSPPTNDRPIPSVAASAGSDFTSSHAVCDTQSPPAAGEPNLPPTTDRPIPNEHASAGSNFTSSHVAPDPQSASAAGDQAIPDSQDMGDTQRHGAVGDHNLPPSKEVSTPIPVSTAAPNLPDSQSSRDTQPCCAVGDQTTERSQTASDTQGLRAALGAILADPVLGVLADVVDDLEKVRCANQNRLRALTDQSELGHGLTLAHPEVARLAAIVADIADSEHRAILNLQRCIRRHPLGVWAKPIAGVGEKQLARLLSVIGDPYWNDLHDRPRTVSELWAFCGYHVIHTSGGHGMPDTHCNRAAGSDATPATRIKPTPSVDASAGVAPKRQRGQKSNWNEDARKRCYLIAESCIKQAKSPYRPVYDATRTKYAEAVHTTECVRCGPKGKPAQPGTPLSAGHQHARAMRAVSKLLLKELWREAQRIHQTQHEQAAA